MIFEQEKTHALPSRDVSIVGSSLKPAAKANSISQTRYKWSDIFTAPLYKWPNLPNGAFTGLVIQKIHGKSRLFNNGILIFMVYEIIPIWLGQLFSPRTSEVIHFCPGPWNNWRLWGPFFFWILSPWHSSARREFRAWVSRMSNQPTQKSTNHLGDLKQNIVRDTVAPAAAALVVCVFLFGMLFQKSPQIDLLKLNAISPTQISLK